MNDYNMDSEHSSEWYSSVHLGRCERSLTFCLEVHQKRTEERTLTVLCEMNYEM